MDDDPDGHDGALLGQLGHDPTWRRRLRPPRGHHRRGREHLRPRPRARSRSTTTLPTVSISAPGAYVNGAAADPFTVTATSPDTDIAERRVLRLLEREPRAARPARGTRSARPTRSLPYTASWDVAGRRQPGCSARSSPTTPRTRAPTSSTPLVDRTDPTGSRDGARPAAPSSPGASRLERLGRFRLRRRLARDVRAAAERRRLLDGDRERHVRPVLGQLGHLGAERRLRPPRRDDRRRGEHPDLGRGHGHRRQHRSVRPGDHPLRIEPLRIRLRADDLRQHGPERKLRRRRDELGCPVGDPEDPLPRTRGRFLEPVRDELRLRRSLRLADRHRVSERRPDRLRHVHRRVRHERPERVLAHGPGRRSLRRQRPDGLGEPGGRRRGRRQGRVPLLRRLELQLRGGDDNRLARLERPLLSRGTASPPTARTRSSPARPTTSGNTTDSAERTVTVDNTGPTSALSVNEGTRPDLQYFDSATDTYYYNPVASGDFALHDAASDPAGIQSIAFPAFADTGFTGAAKNDTTAPYDSNSYSFTTASVSAPATQMVVVTDSLATRRTMPSTSSATSPLRRAARSRTRTATTPTAPSSSRRLTAPTAVPASMLLGRPRAPHLHFSRQARAPASPEAGAPSPARTPSLPASVPSTATASPTGSATRPSTPRATWSRWTRARPPPRR